MEPWVKPLLTWYRRNRRDLPFRGEKDPYKIWISEVMLQQTQVRTMLSYYARFIERFPTAGDLARADLEEVLKIWQGLGYYARARGLHEAACVIVERFDGRLPGARDGLLSLPGFGPYTAASVASIAFHEPVAALDGNAFRFFSRLTNQPRLRSGAPRKEWLARLEPILNAVDPGDFNQAVMEWGALGCTPRRPACPECPVRPYCRAAAEGTIDACPAPKARKKRPRIEVAAAVLVHRNRILLTRRRPDQMLGGLWEFPGGKRKEGETIQETMVREIEEELGIGIEVLRPLCVIRHSYSHFDMTLHALLCRRTDRRPLQLLSADARAWVAAEELSERPLPAADVKIVEEIRKAGPALFREFQRHPARKGKG